MSKTNVSIASDILLYNGSRWVSFRNGNIFFYNGSEFVNANEGNIHVAINGGFYQIPVFTIPAANEGIVGIPRSIFFIANPVGLISVIEKPSWVKATITGNAIMLEQDGFVLTGARGLIRLSCSNGAPDVTIEVELL